MGKAAEEASAKAGAREVDHEALAQAHVNAITGACMAIGIKHAGTGSAAAQALLSDYILYLLDAKNAAVDSLSGACICQCLNLQGTMHFQQDVCGGHLWPSVNHAGVPSYGRPHPFREKGCKSAGHAGGPVAWGQLDKAAAETCICAVTLSLAAVMAGSGHLQTMCLIRSARTARL